MKVHITPGYNGWTPDAKRIISGIGRAQREKLYAETTAARAEERERAELEYYADNNCFPRPTGYFGTETDAHLYEM